jgi:hypothetical protein
MGGRNNRWQQSEARSRRQEEAFYLERAARLATRKRQQEAADTGVIFTLEPKSDE